MRSLALRNTSTIRTRASTTERVITADRHVKMIQRTGKGVSVQRKLKATTYWKWATSEWAAGRRWSPFGSRCQRWWRLCPLSQSGSCTPRSNARYLRRRQRRNRIKAPVCCGRGGGEVGRSLTVADSNDDPKDEDPEEDVGGVAQQQDEEEADHHGYHQSTAATQTPEDLSRTPENGSESSGRLGSNQEWRSLGTWFFVSNFTDRNRWDPR